MEPGFWKKNRTMIALCYHRLGDLERAAKWLRLALEMPTVTDDDREVDDVARKMLKRVGAAE